MTPAPTLSVGDRLRAIDVAMTAAPWDYVPDECDGKEEVWGYWHRIGPISLLGKEGRPDTLGIRDIRNALPALAAHADAADALRDMAVAMMKELEARGVDLNVVLAEHVGVGAKIGTASKALLAALDGEVSP